MEKPTRKRTVDSDNLRRTAGVWFNAAIFQVYFLDQVAVLLQSTFVLAKRICSVRGGHGMNVKFENSS